MMSFQKKNFNLIRRYPIVGGRRLSNYWWSLVLFFGGCGFLLTGISSYFNRNILLPHFMVASPLEQPLNIFMGWNKIKSLHFFDVKVQHANVAPNLSFFPQGLVLSFYGFLGLCFSFHLWFTLFWKIGEGFNEFNGKEKYVRIFRWGRPGKNRRIDLKYNNEFIETIKVELVPRPALFLCIKGEKNIPLTRVGESIPLEELEAQAAELTSLLQVPLEIENAR